MPGWRTCPMHSHQEHIITSALDAAGLAQVVTNYYATCAREVRVQLDRWRRQARSIPNRRLRALAVHKLSAEHLNAEAAAVFATLAPPQTRRRAVRLAVAYEVLYDYLDGVSEEPASDPVANGLHLHRALSTALSAPQRPIDYYAHGCTGGDGGYIDSLTAACRHEFGLLPAATTVLPVALAAAERCGEGQTRTHAVASAGVEQLSAWVATLDTDSGYAWWEVAAGTASSLALHAILVTAASPDATADDAHRADRAYWPSICALSTLLDSLIDYEADTASDTDHSYVAYYPSLETAAQRLGQLAVDGDRAVRSLRHPRRHAAIAAGVTGFYLSAAHDASAAAKSAIVGAISPALIRPVLALAALRRRRA